MTLDITGIHNVGEFYSQHYLDALLERDLKETLKRWAEDDKDKRRRAPYKVLGGLSSQYFQRADRAYGSSDASERLAQARAFHAELLEALGYARNPSLEPVGKHVVPVALAEQHGGQPYLWVLEAPFGPSQDDSAPLDEAPLPEQVGELLGPNADADDVALLPGSFRDMFDGDLLRQDRPPRWVLLLAGSDAFLVDRDKWAQGQYLHFDLGVLLGRGEGDALKAVAGLLHREVLLPEGGQSLLDQLDENSHKHAFAVSTDLKFGVQRAIELIGNEVVHYIREVKHEKLFDRPELARDLSRECITYLYRLLFLFYVEARGRDLGVVPMGADVYREGYSLESLRDLELVPLHSEQARNGYFLHVSLEKLFLLVQRGFRSSDQVGMEDVIHDSFSLPGLRSPLFDPVRTPILRGVRLRNAVLQEVIQLLSLSRETGRKSGRGRISYALLGINQLGAVYEGLLSYTGFFAQDDVYEVRAEKEVSDPDARTYFVPEVDIHHYKDGEQVKDDHGRPVKHGKGTFLFRLSGRDRETSASYYTPEVLTRCLTKYTLMERLGESIVDKVEGKPVDPDKLLSADEILELTICEPAMGSGAFMNEAVNQLADAYLSRKQAELGEQIPAERYQAERQKVKYHFITQRCYGVDLNPLATELGKVSLWLNALQPGVEAPYLDLRLAVGNSLIGARRECFTGSDLTARRRDESWQVRVPRRVPPGEVRGPEEIYHFLVPNPDMAPFHTDKVIKQLEPDNVKLIKKWRTGMLLAYDEATVRRLLSLCDRIDTLWAQHLADRKDVLAATHQKVQLWGQPELSRLELRPKSVEECEDASRHITSPEAAGQRLRGVMDYWCALWFWPIQDAGKLPTRDQWLADVEALLEGEGQSERLAVVDAVVARQRFFHWELQFADVFAARGGMDVVLGNPPWIKLEWEESGILGDLEPELVLRKLTAKAVADRRATVLEGDEARAAFLSAFEGGEGAQTFLNAPANYPLLRGFQTNLYKCFLARVQFLACGPGSGGLLHQKGAFDDPHGGRFRGSLATRLRLHAHFINKLLLFPDIKDEKHYELTIQGAEGKWARFVNLSNAFHPRTLGASLAHDGRGVVPAIKDDNNDWDLRGHRSRLVVVDERALGLFAKLYDKPGTPALEARLPVVHSREILAVLQRFAEAPRSLADLGDEYFATVCFDETGRVKDGTIARETRFPKDTEEWVVSGPHFYVGTPFNKTPNEGCRHNQDYASIDLTVIPDDYLPRTNYVPACDPDEYRSRTPSWRGKPVTDYWRHAHRKMLAPTGERTLVSCVVPPGPATIITAITTSFEDSIHALELASFTASVPFDFFLKTTGKADLTAGAMGFLPWPPRSALTRHQLVRAARLNCSTHLYAPLWAECTRRYGGEWSPARDDARLARSPSLGEVWTHTSPLRTPYARRQALVELDALAALALGMTVEELVLIYRVQFPVLQMYERETFYDQRGKIVFTVNRGMSDVGVSRKQWEEIRQAKAGDTLPEWAHDQQGPFVPPFDSRDREADMREAYAHFERLLAEDGARGEGG